MLIALLLVAAATPPEATAINMQSWFKADDYPAEAMAKGIQGNVKVEVNVDADGKPTTCRVAQSSGSELLDQTTCRIVLERGRYLPAKVGGKAVPGVVSNTTTWRLADSLPMDGYFAAILDYSKNSDHPECSVVEKGIISGPSCEQVLADLGPLAVRERMSKVVALMSVTRDNEEPYRGEADWGQRLSFSAVDLYLSKEGKRACTVVALEGEARDPCAGFNAEASLTDEEKRTASKQHLERSLFGIFESSTR